MKIKYNNTNRKNFKQIEVNNEPVILEIPTDGEYTLMMIDPDAFQPRQNDTYFLHWLVTNIQNGDISQGDTRVEYYPPTPPSGTHEYIFILYKQLSGSLVNGFNKQNQSKWKLTPFLSGKSLKEIARTSIFVKSKFEKNNTKG